MEFLAHITRLMIEDNIIKDIANDLIGHNFNSITVKSPRQGSSTLNVSKAAFSIRET